MDEEDQHRPKRPRLMVRLGRNNSANRTANPENEALSTPMDPEQPAQPGLSNDSEPPEESEKHDEHETPMKPEAPKEPEVERNNNILEQLSTLPRHLEAIGSVGASFGQSVMEKLQHLEAKLDNLGQGTAATNNSPLLEEHNQLKALHAQVQDELKFLKTEMAEKEATIQSQKQHTDALRKQNNEFALKNYEMAAQQNTPTQAQGPDDSAISDATDSLDDAIQVLACTSFKGAPFRKPRTKKYKEVLETLTGDLEQCIRYLTTDVELKSCVVEATIWDRLIQSLLGTPLAAYNGSMNMDISLKLNLGANAKHFATSRASLANLMHHQRDGFHPDWRDGGENRVALVDELVENLANFHSDPDCNESLWCDIDMIVKKAVTLAGMMARSRAFWVITMNAIKPTPTVHDYEAQRRYGFMVQEKQTKVVRVDGPDKHKGGVKVGMVVRPLQLKWGDSSGHGYEGEPDVKRKREVVAIPLRRAIPRQQSPES